MEEAKKSPVDEILDTYMLFFEKLGRRAGLPHYLQDKEAARQAPRNISNFRVNEGKIEQYELSLLEQEMEALERFTYVNSFVGDQRYTVDLGS